MAIQCIFTVKGAIMPRIDFVAKQLTYQANILATFRQATSLQIADGKVWYPQAIEELDAYKHVWPSHRVRAAVCAMLSPRITWASNLEGVKRISKAILQYSSLCPTVAGLRRNVDKAWETAHDSDLTRVSGPKVSAFYANLCGDFQRVTIDVWAARTAGVSDSEMTHLDRNRYKCLERAYQTIAAELYFQPAELQAIVWIVERGHGDGTMAGTNQPRWNKDEVNL